MENNRQMPKPSVEMPAEQPQVSFVEPPKPDIVPDEVKTADMEVKIPSSGIEVVALHAGYIHHCRKVEGDRFKIANMDQLGDWMEIADPKLEKQRQAAKAAKKAEEMKKAGK